MQRKHPTGMEMVVWKPKKMTIMTLMTDMMLLKNVRSYKRLKKINVQIRSTFNVQASRT